MIDQGALALVHISLCTKYEASFFSASEVTTIWRYTNVYIIIILALPTPKIWWGPKILKWPRNPFGCRL